MRYYATIAWEGAIPFGQFPFSIGVHEHPRGSPGPNPPVGWAGEVGRTEDGLALWRLTIRGADLPRRFLIRDGEFVPAKSNGPVAAIPVERPANCWG